MYNARCSMVNSVLIVVHAITLAVIRLYFLILEQSCVQDLYRTCTDVLLVVAVVAVALPRATGKQLGLQIAE
jgi:hypothetical protein